MMRTLPEILSAERFATYQGWASQDDTLAQRLYTYNVQLSAALYGPLHIVEIALRNVVDQKMTGAFGPDWWNDPQVLRSRYQQSCVDTAAKTLNAQGKAGKHGQMVAKLNFGFWCSLFGKESHHLWQKLRPVFQAKGLQRGRIAGDLKEIRGLRNRVAHYEPILALPLAQHYATITTLTSWLSTSAAAWTGTYSTWASLYPNVSLIVPDPMSGRHKVSDLALQHLPT